MDKHALVEQLINAHIRHTQQQLSSAASLEQDIQVFSDWLQQQTLGQIWTLEQIQALLMQQIMLTPANAFLIEQIADHIRFAVIHPLNQSTTIEQLIPAEQVDQIAKYISRQSSQRKALIKSVVNNSAFNNLISQLIQKTLQDYMENGMLAKKVPGVGRFMKMGKSVLESVTDSNLDDTIGHYLHKNISKISQMSEQVINQYFSDDKLYQLQSSIWHKVKSTPLSTIQQYVKVDEINQAVDIGHGIWEYLRQSNYIQQQVHDGLATWYARNQARAFKDILNDINITDALIQNQLGQVMIAVLQPLLLSDAFADWLKQHYVRFYASDEVQKILDNA